MADIFCHSSSLLLDYVQFARTILGSSCVRGNVKHYFDSSKLYITFLNIRLDEEWILTKWVPFINMWIKLDADVSSSSKIREGDNGTARFINFIISSIKRDLVDWKDILFNISTSFKSILEYTSNLLNENLDSSSIETKNIYLSIVYNFLTCIQTISNVINPLVKKSDIGDIEDIFIFSDDWSEFTPSKSSWMHISQQLYSMNNVIDFLMKESLAYATIMKHKSKGWKERLVDPHENIEKIFSQMERLNGELNISLKSQWILSKNLTFTLTSWRIWQKNFENSFGNSVTKFTLSDYFKKSMTDFSSGMKESFSIIRDLTPIQLSYHGLYTIFPYSINAPPPTSRYITHITGEPDVYLGSDGTHMLYEDFERDSLLLSKSNDEKENGTKVGNKIETESENKNETQIEETKEIDAEKNGKDTGEPTLNRRASSKSVFISEHPPSCTEQVFVAYSISNADELELYSEFYHLLLDKRSMPALPKEFPNNTDMDYIVQHEYSIPFFFQGAHHKSKYRLSPYALEVAQRRNKNCSGIITLLYNLLNFAEREYSQNLQEMIRFGKKEIENHVTKESITSWALLVDLILDFEVVCGLDLSTERLSLFGDLYQNNVRRLLRIGRFLQVSQSSWGTPFSITLPDSVQHQTVQLVKDYLTTMDDFPSYNVGILQSMFILSKTSYLFYAQYRSKFILDPCLSDHHLILERGMYLAFSTIITNERYALLSREWDFLLFGIGLSMYRFCLLPNNLASITFWQSRNQHSQLVHSFFTVLFYVWMFGGNIISNALNELVVNLVQLGKLDKLQQSIKNSVIIGYLFHPSQAENILNKKVAKFPFFNNLRFNLRNSAPKSCFDLKLIQVDILHSYLNTEGGIDEKLQDLIAKIYSEQEIQGYESKYG